MKAKFPNYKQSESKDCGPTCLKIIAEHFGKSLSIEQLRQISETTREGSNLLNLSEAGEFIGFRTLGIRLSLIELNEAPMPCILHWNNNHYVVLYKVYKNRYYISDPAHGLITYNKEEFLKFWIGSDANENTQEGIALMLDTTPNFLDSQLDFEQPNKLNFNYLFKYLVKYKSLILQLVIGLLAGSLLQLIVPFLTQSIVDVGIKNNDLNFIYLILIAQLTLYIGRYAIEIIRGWILLHVSTRINISLVSDFFIKLMKLPISYFDVKMTGDLLQRINDHNRIEKILTVSSLNVLFSTFNFIIFSFVLAYYNLLIFAVFLIGSILYFFWIHIFLKKRADLDYKRFSATSNEQSKVIELINGMQEIKLHNAETQKRWGWEYTQVNLFKVSIKNLTLEQTQSIGSSFINELKNILITVLAAKLVIEGEITLGMMLAISYIVGQLNSPVQQLINFIRELQDAKISLDRLSEIHNKEDEEISGLISQISNEEDIFLDDVSFRYQGSDVTVIKNLSLIIPANKTTAIVGLSGSGKTTLLKLLLRFYDPIKGSIYLGKTTFKNISNKSWRANYGVVMQEGYIFNDTIANNISIGEEIIDKQRLSIAVDIANIKVFIESLPKSYNTMIGNEGVGLSSGQKQRLLIARAIYKDPSYLFFDEATSALDANTEKTIIENLNTFFKKRTVVVVAHRLSTVKNAHNIVVLESGQIVEMGSHQDLINKKGAYFNLVKNQLDLEG